MAYKYKLSEMSKSASPEEAEKELGIPKRKFEIGQVTYSDDGQRKSEVTGINPETGTISWKVTQLPGFEKLYDEMDDLVDVSKRVYVKTKDDKKFREFYEDARKLRNKIRTHLRNEYPDQYKRIVGVNESINEVDVVDLAPGTQVKAKNYIQDPKTYADTILDISDEILDAESDTIAKNPQVTQVLRILKKISSRINEEIKLNILPKNNIAILKGDSGEYDGFIEDGEVSFSTTYDDLDYRITDEYDESNIEDFLGRGHAFVELAKKYDYDWNIEPDLVGITIKLENDVDEVSMSGAAGAYNTPYAFVRKPVKLKGKNKKKRYKYQMTKPSGLVGYMDNSVNEVIDLVHVYDKDGEIFGTGEIVQQFKDTAKVRFDGNFMGTFRNDRIKPVQESNDPGATLGPGPAAGPDGVTDSAYTKQFKYKLVPKNKNGTYVQKGSGLEVKKLF